MLNPDPKRRLTAQEVLGRYHAIHILLRKLTLFFSSNFSTRKQQDFNTTCSLNTDHPWLINAKKAPNVSLGETVRARLKQFSVMNKLKKRALRVMFLTLFECSFGNRPWNVYPYGHLNKSHLFFLQLISLLRTGYC